MMRTRAILRSAAAAGGRQTVAQQAPYRLYSDPIRCASLPWAAAGIARAQARRRFSVRTRFAPSPTGSLHIGGLRTALFNYLYAKRMGGQFLLRIEDTDKTREVPGSIEEIQGMLAWCGIVPDEGPPGSTAAAANTTDNDGSSSSSSSRSDCGPYIQSERLHVYREHCQRLVDSGAAYPCFCSKERLADLKAQRLDALDDDLDSVGGGAGGEGIDGGAAGARGDGGGDDDGAQPKQQQQQHRSGYDGHCSHIDSAEARRRVEEGEPHTIRLRVPRSGGGNKGGAGARAGASGLCSLLFPSLCASGKTVSFDDELRGIVRVDVDRVDDQVLMKSDGFPT
jgi:nondiscriminating glutamyl-tRNA synthetase